MDAQDQRLIMLLASSSASLAEVPGKNNWIERANGDLPPYVRKLARGIMKSGKTKSQAIAIAISRIKVWAAGGDDVNADTRAKAAKALAQWEALKAKNASKKLVKASRDDGSTYLMLANSSSFNVEMVSSAWRARVRDAEKSGQLAEDALAPWVTEQWSDYIIVSDYGGTGAYFKVPFTVTGGVVDFGDPVPVERKWVEVKDEDLNEAERKLLKDVLIARGGDLDKVRTFTKRAGS